MARLPHGGGLRSVIVVWLRLLLPLAALALLATLFMWSGRPDPQGAIPYADVDPASLAGAPRITAPNWAGVTSDGAEMALAAAIATPQGDSGARAEQMRLSWSGPKGTTAMASAPIAAMNDADIALSGGVDVQLSSGWSLKAASLSASRLMAEVTASGGVTITAPFGTLTADKARLHRPHAADESPSGGEVLDFTGQVRLIYHP